MVRSEPANVYMPKNFLLFAERIYNFKLRPDDIWIVTYPKCGTTWAQVIFSNCCLMEVKTVATIHGFRWGRREALESLEERRPRKVS
jgi:hypothetical protein